MIDKILEFKHMCQLEGEIGRSCGLSPREIRCVTVTAQKGPLSSKELSRLIELSPSRGSRVIGRMVDKGLIQMIQSDQDRRSVKLSLSDKGQECFKQIEKDKAACEARLLASLTDEELKMVNESLNLLIKAL